MTTGLAAALAGAAFAGFLAAAPANDPRVAVAVFVENGGIGGQVAAPIARQVMQAVLGS